MADRQRSDYNGRYESEYPVEDVIDALSDLGRATSPEIAERIGSKRVTAYRKLQRMEERNEVTSRKIGGNRIWRLPDNPKGD